MANPPQAQTMMTAKRSIATGPLMGAAVARIAPARVGVASALINVARMCGAALGVAVAGTLYHADGGTQLAVALLVCALVQGVCVAWAWKTLRKQRAHSRSARGS